MSRYSSTDTRIQRIHILVDLLEVPIPQTTSYESDSILELSPPIGEALARLSAVKFLFKGGLVKGWDQRTKGRTS